MGTRRFLFKNLKLGHQNADQDGTTHRAAYSNSKDEALEAILKRKIETGH